jgi:release factor glutamine methyltransferase
MNGETLTGLLKKGQMILAQAGIKEAGLDAWLLLEYVTGKSRAYYFAYGEESVTESVAERYLELISRRAGHIPLQHLTHQAFFMGHEFYVDKNVLVPRQDTETLVESALECMKAVKNPYILDMCTGSGCILISILKERADAHGTGVDLSDEALKVAVRNARTLEVAEHAEFVQSNLFSEMQNIVYGTEYMKRTAVKDTVKMTECENSNRNYSRAYDMIISNPPYIPTAEIEDLMDEVKLHDPRMALDGMEDGLYFYRAITKQAQDHLVPGGWLLYEIGCSQGEDVAALLLFLHKIIMHLHISFFPIIIICIDNNKWLIQNLLCGKYSLSGSPGFRAVSRFRKSLRQIIKLLEYIFYFRNFLNTLADHSAKLFFQIFTDNKHYFVKSGFQRIVDGIIHNNLSTCSHRCKLLDSFSKTTSDSCRHNYKCCFLHKYFPPDILLSYQYFFSHLLSHTLSAIFYSAS